MKRYAVHIAPRVKKQADSLPSHIKPKIADVIENIIAVTPYIGKALKAELRGLYSYRLGDYRIIYNVLKDTLTVQILKIMHRREVYR